MTRDTLARAVGNNNPQNNGKRQQTKNDIHSKFQSDLKFIIGILNVLK